MRFVFEQKAQSITQLSLAPKVRATLIGHGDDGWLLLSATAKARSNDEKLAEALFVALKKHRIKRLQAVLVQDDSLVLAKAVGRLSLVLPVHRLSWAGKPVQFGKVGATHCEAGQAMPLPNGQIKVLTGWQLNAAELSGCAVVIDTKQGVAQLIDARYSDERWQVYRLLCPAPISADWQGEQELPEALKGLVLNTQ